ncbi:MAG: hypothetical protein JKX69_01895 [Rhodobacteraceae bacterium]|nr:hypothetical protein [Paracoccaceae bacterium]
MTGNRHSHDLGLANDMPRMIGRRRLLTLLSGIGLTAASGLPALAAECVALPWETAGPYPGDGTNSKSGQIVNVLTEEGVIREDLRTSFGSLTPVADGLRLDLELTFVDADGCGPLEDHAIYLWHCDTTGKYSLYDTVNANYLRGVGITDAEGKVRFTTIVPGCYDGRWPHFHFEVFSNIEAAISGEASVLTAQIALPEETCAAVYATDNRYPNGTRNLSRITIASDNVFADNTAAQIEQQMLKMTGDPQNGYQGELSLPVDFTADRSNAMGQPPGGFGGDRLPPPQNN